MQPDELILQLKKQNEVAFFQIYDTYSEHIFGIITNIVKHVEIAEEVLQDVFIKVWNKSDSYSSDKGLFFTWLLNISRNAAIDKVRSKAYKNKRKNFNFDDFFLFIKEDMDLDSQSDAYGLRQFVDRLKPMCVKLIDLLFFKGYTQKEVSETLDISIGIV
ncbi:RNA polymerase sigma factor, sigma70 family SigK-like protein [Psychroflexus torquis ATCC 700755]|uniref:RNA polymerase sigma factor n=1 Tax=Psychroflexus torquis (strain ATCC 700755 / CIP 106069 / ACAM 623) TaxID=313595 RepID=K4IJF7_PSYTT|nr:sigma-70 family RNA polymerase sigma factor [Psychroflexus torquis]AFU69241.1 RNA polymerase sigma factor, sigma70 family SigK-like protein [Psychroflexus torquis ATCC 700755]